MNHNRFIVFPREFEVPGEGLFLLGERRAVPIAVETRFAHGGDARLRFDEPDDAVPIDGLGFGDVIRLNADGGPDSRKPIGDGDARPVRRGIDADGDDADDAGLDGALDDLRQVAGEAIVEEVGVRVDEWHGDGRLLTGNETRGDKPPARIPSPIPSINRPDCRVRRRRAARSRRGCPCRAASGGCPVPRPS